MPRQICTTVDLLRHGEPEGGVRFRGRLNDPLNENGWTQMRAAVANRTCWQLILTSPLERCAAFSRQLAVERHLEVHEEKGFEEMAFGRWEGRTTAGILRDEPDALRAFWREPSLFGPPGGETLQAFAKRVGDAWTSLLQRHEDCHVLLVTHGGVIRILLANILGMPHENLFRLEVPFAAMSRIRIFGQGVDASPILVFHAALPPVSTG